MIVANEQAGAIGMLRSRSNYRIGRFDGVEFFIVDGKLWKIENAIAYRYDDSDDADRVSRACRELRSYLGV